MNNLNSARATNRRIDINEVVPMDNLRAGVFYLDNGEVLVIDSKCAVIDPQEECDLFPVCDVKQIEKIESSTTITIRGSHYMLKTLGDKIYKIPLLPPHPLRSDSN